MAQTVRYARARCARYSSGRVQTPTSWISYRRIIAVRAAACALPCHKGGE